MDYFIRRYAVSLIGNQQSPEQWKTKERPLDKIHTAYIILDVVVFLSQTAAAIEGEKSDLKLLLINTSN